MTGCPDLSRKGFNGVFDIYQIPFIMVDMGKFVFPRTPDPDK